MNMRDLIPWGRNDRSMVPGTMRGDETSPFLTLHREMNRLFDDVFSRFEGGMPSLLGRMPAWPSIEATETDKEVRISAELPGMDEKDIEVLVDEDVLTIRGEKKAETEDKERRFSERYYGRFERVIPLPFCGRGGQGRSVVCQRRADRDPAQVRKGAGEDQAHPRQRERQRRQALTT